MSGGQLSISSAIKSCLPCTSTLSTSCQISVDLLPWPLGAIQTYWTRFRLISVEIICHDVYGRIPISAQTCTGTCAWKKNCLAFLLLYTVVCWFTWIKWVIWLPSNDQFPQTRTAQWNCLIVDRTAGQLQQFSCSIWLLFFRPVFKEQSLIHWCVSIQERCVLVSHKQ